MSNVIILTEHTLLYWAEDFEYFLMECKNVVVLETLKYYMSLS